MCCMMLKRPKIASQRQVIRKELLFPPPLIFHLNKFNFKLPNVIFLTFFQVTKWNDWLPQHLTLPHQLSEVEKDKFSQVKLFINQQRGERT